jgi:hypothetical protein
MRYIRVLTQHAFVAFFDRILNILNGRLKSEALRLSLTRREPFDRYAAQHEVRMTTRFECARCQTLAYCYKGASRFRIRKAHESDSSES